MTELVSIINRELSQQFDVPPNIANDLEFRGVIFLCMDCDAYHVAPEFGNDALQRTWDRLRTFIERLRRAGL